MDFLKQYGTEGPLGFPMIDRQAKNLEVILKTLPKTREFEYKKTVFSKAPTELNPGERSDVSWISTETVDRYGHVVFAKGMNDSQFALNPIVTLNHNYAMPPIGRSLWRKFVKDGDQRGIKAKTVYPQKPDNWEGDWAPDKVLALIQAGLLNAKSIGWVPTKAHFALEKESTKNNWPLDTLVIEEWLLIEYSVGTIPVNPETVVEIVSKTALPREILETLGWKLPQVFPKAEVKREERILFTPLCEIENALNRKLNSIDLPQLIQELFDKKRGRV